MTVFKSPTRLAVIITFILTTTIHSCNQVEYANSIDLSQNQKVSVFDVFSTVEAIQLEMTQSSLITQIKRIESYNSRYYILDERSQQIFCFDEQGQYIFKISAQGKGPGEYHYITDFSIDYINEQLVILDPVVQKIHVYDLNGKHVSTHNITTDKAVGLNRVYTLPDSLLLLISITDENLIIYSLREQKVVYADLSYDVPSTLHAFSPRDNVCFYDNKSLILIPLTNEIAEITAEGLKPYYKWCFGQNNNSEKQIDNLLKAIKIKQDKSKYFLTSYQAVGKNKILNHHMLKYFENSKFKIAALEFEDDFKFVVIDKKENNPRVFNSFQEGVRFPYLHLQSDRAITFYEPEFEARELAIIERKGLENYFFNRSHKYYSKEFMDEISKNIIENHDPLVDNPFLVVYKFKQ